MPDGLGDSWSNRARHAEPVWNGKVEVVCISGGP